MIRTGDPHDMTPDERIGELASILALGYLRHLAEKSLDSLPEVEAPCVETVDAGRTQ